MEINKHVSKEEATEFLKPMKHYEYNVVEQLKKIPARIFLMSLILIYEPHHNALQIVLNKAYVPQNIAQKTMKHFIKRIYVTNYLYFTKHELDARGTSHNKHLYITLRCKDCTIDKVLVDTGSSLNVLQEHMLDENAN